MTQTTTTESPMTIGIDLGDQYSFFAVLDHTGEITEEGRLRTTPAAFSRKFAKCTPARVAIEVGTHSPWINELLLSAGHEVLVANPRKLRFIFRGDNKNDRVDAQQLARVARLDPSLLSPIHHRKRESRVDLSFLRARDGLVRARTRLVNQVRGLVKPFGTRLPSCSTTTFATRIAREIPKELRPAIVPLLRVIQLLTKKIMRMKKRLESIAAENYPEVSRLQQVSGVGIVTATTFVLTLEDPYRFKSSRSVGAYLGLRPKRRQSGKSDPELRISKAGDRDLRMLLVQCGQYILGPFGKDSDLRRLGLALAERGNKSAKRKAVVAVARKLAVLLHRLWVSGEDYEPLRNIIRREAIPQLS